MQQTMVPVLIFAYKRAQHLAKTIKALQKNKFAELTDVFIYVDGPKNSMEVSQVNDVLEVCKGLSGFKSVTLQYSDVNRGLANSIISGVTECVKQFGSIIVLEDDLVTSPNFLQYMNKSLSHYQNEQNVFSIGAFGYPRSIFSLPEKYGYDNYTGYRCCSWGWGTWANRWEKIDWSMKYFEGFLQDANAQKHFSRGGPDLVEMLKDQYQGKIDSWAIRFCYAHFSNEMYCVYPTKTLVQNIGFDNSGTHCADDSTFVHRYIDEQWCPEKFCPGDVVNANIASQFYNIWNRKNIKQTWISKLIKKIHKKTKIYYPEVLFINTHQKTGGAARASWRLFEGVRKFVSNTHYLSLFGERLPNTASLQYDTVRGILARRAKRLDNLSLKKYSHREKNVLFSSALISNPFRRPFHKYKPRIVHVHWVAEGFLRPEELKNFRAPVVWTLHDAWAFTGGCHYVGACKGYLQQCGGCPVLSSQAPNDLSRKNWFRKKNALENINLTVVTPSKWLGALARKSSMFQNMRIEVIPNGINLQVYKPIDKHEAKKYFDLPLDSPVILFGAQDLRDPRKGGHFLSEALAKINKKFTLLTFGSGSLSIVNPYLVTQKDIGALNNDISLAMLYSAADVFVCPSMEDNLPNTVIEALSCGTPCVAFKQGGMAEMIVHKETGWLAECFDVQDLVAGINYICWNPIAHNMSVASRRFAESHYSIDKMVSSYIELYSELEKI